MMNVNHLALSIPIYLHTNAHAYTLTDTAFSPLNCNICDNPPWYVMKAEGKQDICVILLHLMHLNYK